MATVDQVKSQMAANSAAWKTASAAKKKELEQANQKLGQSIGGTYSSGSGTWKFPTASTTTSSSSSSPSSSISYTGTGSGTSAVTASTTAKQKREAQMAQFTGWDNDPQVKSLQEKTWAIYLDTGKWDSAAQVEYHAQAEKIRNYNNPMYEGLINGPLDWMDAGKITPPDTTPGANTIEGSIDGLLNPDKFGSYAKMGVGAVFVIFLLSMFRR